MGMNRYHVDIYTIDGDVFSDTQLGNSADDAMRTINERCERHIVRLQDYPSKDTQLRWCDPKEGKCIEPTKIVRIVAKYIMSEELISEWVKGIWAIAEIKGGLRTTRYLISEQTNYRNPNKIGKLSVKGCMRWYAVTHM